FPIQLEVRFQDRTGYDAVFVTRQQEQWCPGVVPEVDGGCTVRNEICERCLQQNPIRSRHDVTFEGIERFGFCQRVCKRAMKLFPCQRSCFASERIAES